MKIYISNNEISFFGFTIFKIEQGGVNLQVGYQGLLHGVQFDCWKIDSRGSVTQ